MKMKYICLVILVVIFACSKKEVMVKPPPVIYPVSLKCNAQCNQGYLVVVRIYQLNGEVNFNRATVSSIWNDDHRKTLDKELVAWDEFELTAGQEKQLTITLQDGVTHLGFAANFYEPDRDRWKQIRDVTATSPQGAITVEFGKDYLILK